MSDQIDDDSIAETTLHCWTAGHLSANRSPGQHTTTQSIPAYAGNAHAVPLDIHLLTSL